MLKLSHFPPFVHRDVCAAMKYIASQMFVHRDLAARNVLLNSNGQAKVCMYIHDLIIHEKLKGKATQQQKDKAITQHNSPEPVIFHVQPIVFHPYSLVPC